MDSIRSFIDSLAKAGFFPGHSAEDASPRKAIVNNDHEEANVRLKSHLEDLPEEVLNNILTQGLSLRDTQNLAAASRSMHNLIHGVKINQDVFYSKVSADDILRARNIDRLLVNKEQVSIQLLKGAARKGRLDVFVKAKALGVTREDILRLQTPQNYETHLQEKVELGEVEVWRYKNFVCLEWFVLQNVCAAGQLDILRFMHKELNFTANDARWNNNWALREACMNKHLGVVKYLHTGFGLTVEDAREVNNAALGWSGLNGDLELMKYLRKGYGLNTNDARKSNNKILRRACSSGNLEIARYLRDGFFLTEEDFAVNEKCREVWNKISLPPPQQNYHGVL